MSGYCFNKLSYVSLIEEIGNLVLEKLTNLETFKRMNFSKFSFVIIVPTFLSLHQQSVNRLKELLSLNKDSKIPANKLQFDGAVLMLHSSEEKNFDLFLTKAKEQSDCVFLVIQDECHW